MHLPTLDIAIHAVDKLVKLLLFRLLFQWLVVNIEALELLPDRPLGLKEELLHTEACKRVVPWDLQRPLHLRRPLPLLRLPEVLARPELGIPEPLLLLDPSLVPTRYLLGHGGRPPVRCRAAGAPAALLGVRLDLPDQLHERCLRNDELVVLEQVVHADALHVLPVDGRDVSTGPSAVVVDVQVPLVHEHGALAPPPEDAPQVRHQVLRLV
mmetsp:Transcript_101507/g.302806  ORF Transcript_101507/g.302806 Transcript_101507/m.302806 type:complete len:211 (-) Transcript_101507:764-1396(-)